MFELGSVLITPGANTTLNKDDVMTSLANHKKGDFGLVGQDIIDMNNEAISNKTDNVFSMYRDRQDIKFYIITEFANHHTTILLTNEY
jgi:hypothetical protein|nr:MAG TPA: hypothetical protein [Caudoviricetes sp.]